MKKFLTIIALFIVVLSSTPVFASSSTFNSTGSALTGQSSNAMSQDEATRLMNRVNEIRQMDRKNISASEKKELKNELLGMKKRVSEPGAGVYISGTALILIIILLIILL